MCNNFKKRIVTTFLCFYGWKGYMQKGGSWVAAEHTTDFKQQRGV